MTADNVIALPEPRTTPHGIVRAEAIVGDARPSDRADVVVVGGGIIGVMTTYELAKRGLKVVLCEKGEVACEASSRAYGWVMELMMAAANLPLSNLSKSLWADVQADVGELGYRQHGLMYVAEHEAEMEAYAGWLAAVVGLTAPGTRMITADEVAGRIPGATKRFEGGILSPTDGRVEPTIATSRIAKHARSLGAEIVQHCAVRGLDLQGGRVAGVWTERGHIRTDTVLCAAGSWSKLFCGNHGISIPQLYMILSSGRTGPVVDGPAASGGTHVWSWSRQVDGRYSVGGFPGSTKAPITRDALRLYKDFKPVMEMFDGGKGVIDLGRDAWRDWMLPRRWNPRKTSPFERRGARIRNGTARPASIAALPLNQAVFPALADARIEEIWSGPITVTPDNKGFIGPVDQIAGLHLCNGFPLGISWGAALGRLSAEIILGDPPSLDVTPFRVSRFFDGSPREVAM